MPVIHRSALLPYPASTVYEIVNDVALYPDFLPWCADARVLEASESEVVAELALRGRGMTERFTTRNLLTPHERIELRLISGPFRELSGVWTFVRLGRDEGCKVNLMLQFEFAGARALLGGVFSSVFVKAADRLVDAFCDRARSLLG
jgi:ribosome-associated toxin RatA of RatAB toxin-antitoxin module